ncbi:MAG TPA: DNA gyrase C-terminal beta-propeller domain-containing protein, partial [Longimicrobium sp.]|nr:DNA gyrase C-terminal beta-propeller domain-containing protein [Longimicrobium sp.]
LAVTERGFAKRLPVGDLPLQKRDGLGTALHTPNRETGTLAGLREVNGGDDVMAITAVGRTLRVKGDAAPRGTRATEPELLLALSAHDRVVEITPLAEREQRNDDEDGGGPEGSPPLAAVGDDDLSGADLAANAELTAPADADVDAGTDADIGLADQSSADDAPHGIVNKAVEGVKDAAAKVLDLFGG